MFGTIAVSGLERVDLTQVFCFIHYDWMQVRGYHSTIDPFFFRSCVGFHDMYEVCKTRSSYKPTPSITLLHKKILSEVHTWVKIRTQLALLSTYTRDNKFHMMYTMLKI